MTGASGATIRRRAVLIAGHRTSVSIEDAFWTALKEIAAVEGLSLNKLVAAVDEARSGNLSSALRVHVLERLQGATVADRANGPERGCNDMDRR